MGGHQTADYIDATYAMEALITLITSSQARQFFSKLCHWRGEAFSIRL